MEKWKEFFKADRFAVYAGVELLEIKPGYAKARMLVTDEAGNLVATMTSSGYRKDVELPIN